MPLEHYMSTKSLLQSNTPREINNGTRHRDTLAGILPEYILGATTHLHFTQRFDFLPAHTGKSLHALHHTLPFAYLNQGIIWSIERKLIHFPYNAYALYKALQKHYTEAYKFWYRSHSHAPIDKYNLKKKKKISINLPTQPYTAAQIHSRGSIQVLGALEITCCRSNSLSIAISGCICATLHFPLCHQCSVFSFERGQKNSDHSKSQQPCLSLLQ